MSVLADERRVARGDADVLTTLALRARAGERAAGAELVERTQQEVWRLCAVLVGRDARHDPERLARETYRRAFDTLEALRGDRPARLWLLTHALESLRERGVPTTGPAAAWALTQTIGLRYAEAADVLDCSAAAVRRAVAAARVSAVGIVGRAGCPGPEPAGRRR